MKKQKEVILYDQLGKIAPHNIDAEIFVLGAVLTNKYEEYIDIFAFHNKPIDENEIFDFSETKKHFGHWLQSYLLKSKDITGTTGTKRTASDHIIDKLNTMYTSQHIRLFFEKYMNQNNIDEEKAFKDFEKAKQSGITFAKIQSRNTDNKKIFDY